MKPVIVIDPGHGGSDRANRGPTGYIEADGTLMMALAFKEALLNYECKVILTRSTDEYVSLIQRGRIAVDNNAYVFLSLHTNGGGGKGSEVFYSIDIPGDKNIAAKISKAIADEFMIRDRGPKVKESKNYPGEDYLTVIDYPQDRGVPHIFLIEPMFHDNAEEEALLKNPDTMRRIAKAVVPVIASEFRIMTSSKIDADNDGNSLKLVLEKLDLVLQELDSVEMKVDDIADLKTCFEEIFGGRK